MSDTSTYTPPKVWTWEQPNGGEFASINPFLVLVALN